MSAELEVLKLSPLVPEDARDDVEEITIVVVTIVQRRRTDHAVEDWYLEGGGGLPSLALHKLLHGGE